MLDGTVKRIPAREISFPPDGPEGKGTNRIFFPLGHNKFGSLASVAVNPDGFAGSRSYCQDGITVTDVPSPLGRSPQHIALNEAHVCVDLRAKDRLPLDLSRNLIRGESREVWNKLAPRVWSGLISSGALVSNAARSALDSYIVLEYASFEADGRLYVDRDRKLRPLSSLPERGDPLVGFIDSRDPHSADFLEERSVSWVFVPDGISVFEACHYRRKDILKAKKASRHADVCIPHHLQSLVEDDTYGDLSYGDHSYSLVPSMGTVRGMFKCVIEVYTHVSILSYLHKTIFCKQERENCLPIDKLGFLFPCRNSAMVRGISRCGWYYIPYAYYSDLIDVAKSLEFAWEEFLLLLLYAVDSNYNYWRESWWLEQLAGFDDVAVKVSESFTEMLESVFSDQIEDEDVDKEQAAFEIWAEGRLEAGPLSVGRQEYVRREAEWLLDNIIPGLDLSCLASTATPWDKERWENGKL